MEDEGAEGVAAEFRSSFQWGAVAVVGAPAAAHGAVEDLAAVAGDSEALAVAADFLVVAEDRRGDFNFAAGFSKITTDVRRM